MTTVTIIGGGIAGLTAAIACAEHDVQVTVYEAHTAPGGRARSTAPPYVANDGAHAFYSDSPPWRWLAARSLTQPSARLGVSQLTGLRFRHRGRLRLLLPSGLTRMVTLGRRRSAPVERTFQEWASEEFGEAACRAAAGLLGPALFEPDPGRLSAAFVFERLLRVAQLRYPAVTRYPVGGWGSMIARMAARAEEMGVRIKAGTRVDRLPEDGPVIVATSLDAARVLLDDDALRWESGQTALLDVGLRPSRRDRALVFDLDEGGFFERFSGQDSTLAPAGESLFQGAIPLRPGESKAAGIARLERLYDLGTPDWRDRVTWRRGQVAYGRTGALDLPGLTWRDRPAVDRGDGIYLAGDAVAAPGLLAEVSVTSALIAADLVAERLRR